VNGLDIQPALVEEILVRFLRVEAGKFGFTRAVVGLSGGVDSAVSCALAARAFGAKNVLAAMLPYKSSNPESEADAKRVIASLGVESRKTDITKMADGYFETHDVADRVRRGNVLARCRMIVLYDLSVEWNALVVGTSNKTEILLGYSTQWGDSASALNPLGDLYKHQVVELARHLALPASVIDKPPSADLFEGQTDEAELGFTYARVDELLALMVDQRYSTADLVADGFDEKFVLDVARRIVASQFKRLPPVIAKLSERTVNHDFRYLRSWNH
jgi:NAD+ synthase